MKFVVGSDKMGLKIKDACVAMLKEQGHEIEDVGTLSEDKPMPHTPVSYTHLISGFTSRAAASWDCWRKNTLHCRTRWMRWEGKERLSASMRPAIQTGSFKGYMTACMRH